PICLAQLAGDTTLLTVRVAAQRVQSAEARRLRRFLLRVVQRVFAAEEGARREAQALQQLRQQECLERIDSHNPRLSFSATRVPPGTPQAPSPRRSTPASRGAAPSIRGA